MRISIFTFLITMFIMNIALIQPSYAGIKDAVVDEYAIFDPATVDTSILADGMSIVDINGKKYLQVIVNGWNSTINVPEFPFTPGMTAFAEFKYVIGQDQYTAAQINAGVQLNDTVNLMKPSWSNDSVATTTGLIQSNPSGEFVKTSAQAAPTMKVVHQVQFFGQETTGWGAVVGDTLWVGKVRAYAADPLAIINPATFDPADLPAGTEIVKIDGISYFKVALNGWNTSFNVGSFVAPARTTHASMMVKLDPTGSGFELANVNTFLKFADPNWVEIVSSGSGSSADFAEYKLTIAAGDTIGIFQFAGQETTGWNSIVGGYIYIGKVSAVQAPAKAAITFVVDDSALKSSTGFGLKGSWNTATGEFDAAWNNGDEHAKFYDDGTHGDKTAGDNIWSVTLELVSDGGANNWEWGVNNAKGNWLYGNFRFTVANDKAQTLTHSNTVSAKNFGLGTCKVYPNPATDFISIEGKEFKSVEIYNITGVKVLISKAISQQIDISSLKQGSYIVKALTSEGQNLISRFNKN